MNTRRRNRSWSILPTVYFLDECDAAGRPVAYIGCAATERGIPVGRISLTKASH